jgi:hypothetical protein
MGGNVNNGDIDPELASLLGTAGSGNAPMPDLSDIFGGKDNDDFANISSSSGGEIDLAASEFPQVANIWKKKVIIFLMIPIIIKPRLLTRATSPKDCTLFYKNI